MTFQANMATFPSWRIRNSSRAAHGGARARAESDLSMSDDREHAQEAMSTWNSDRSPLRIHFGFQANMANFPLWTIRNSARVAHGGACARAREESELSMSDDREHAQEAM